MRHHLFFFAAMRGDRQAKGGAAGGPGLNEKSPPTPHLSRRRSSGSPPQVSRGHYEQSLEEDPLCIADPWATSRASPPPSPTMDSSSCPRAARLEVGSSLLAAVVKAKGSRQVVAATAAAMFRLVCGGDGDYIDDLVSPVDQQVLVNSVAAQRLASEVTGRDHHNLGLAALGLHHTVPDVAAQLNRLRKLANTAKHGDQRGGARGGDLRAERRGGAGDPRGAGVVEKVAPLFVDMAASNCECELEDAPLASSESRTMDFLSPGNGADRGVGDAVDIAAVSSSSSGSAAEDDGGLDFAALLHLVRDQLRGSGRPELPLDCDLDGFVAWVLDPRCAGCLPGWEFSPEGVFFEGVLQEGPQFAANLESTLVLLGLG